MKWYEILIGPFRAPNGTHDKRLEEMEKELRAHEAKRDETVALIVAAIDKSDMKRTEAKSA